MNKIRFRIDPVPHTNKTFWNLRFFRKPRTTNEQRQYYRDFKHASARNKRSPLALYHAWDDLNRCIERSWKSQCKRPRQYKIVSIN